MKSIKLWILTLGVFSIINTEMGVVGILPMLAQQFQVSISEAGLFVSLFALAVAIAGPTMPLLCSGKNRKHMMLFVLGTFTICNIIAAYAPTFRIALLMRVLPAILHPVYISMAFSYAASMVEKQDIAKASAKVMMGVSAGMVLGVPFASYLANAASLRIAMLFFALINGVVLLMTLLFIPSSPVTHRMRYKEQLGILKERRVWLSFAGVMLLNGSIFGVFSFLSEYLVQVSGFTSAMVGVILFVYGLANMIGNAVAGRMLGRRPQVFMVTVLCSLFCVYSLQLITGAWPITSLLLLFAWGILAGCVGNINQYWMTSAAPQVPDFANGLFLASTNLGTTVATALSGFLIARFTLSSLYAGGIFLLLGCTFFLMQYRKQDAKGLVIEMSAADISQ